jgi:hypothetical protein
MHNAAGMTAHVVVGAPATPVVKTEAAHVCVLNELPGLNVTFEAICAIGVAAFVEAYRITADDCNAPQAAWPTAVYALFVTAVNCGTAIAARMPIITMTTTSSIRVNPACAIRFIWSRSPYFVGANCMRDTTFIRGVYPRSAPVVSVKTSTKAIISGGNR